MDLIILNSTIKTMNDLTPSATAIAIKDGKIVSLGSNEDMLALSNNDTEIMDLKGKLLLPGFNDSHMHLINYGISLQLIDLDKYDSIATLIEYMRSYIESNYIPEGTWIRGMRWNHHLFKEKRLLNRFDLDQISMKHPIILSRVCGHVIAANSKAMEIAGIDSSTSQVEGGHFDVDEKGNPLGIFRENAIYLIYNKLPKPSLQTIKNDILYSVNRLLKYGITSVQSDDFVILPDNYELIIRAYKELMNENKLHMRIYQQCNFKDIHSFHTFLNKGYTSEIGGSLFKIGPLKLLADGSLGARTAYLKEPYSDDTSTYGIPVFSQEELTEFITTAHNAGMHVAVHAIGDKTNEMVLNSIETAMNLNPRKDARHSIIHCQITDNEILDRYKDLNIIAHIQPLFVSTDLHFVEERVGSNRAETSYNWKGMLNRGIRVAFGSDCPVESPNVMYGIYAAVTRRDLQGFPENGWFPTQKLSVEEAVYGYTMGSAYASFEEHIKGSLTPGKVADMVVLSENIFEINPSHIKDVKVIMTFFNGKLVYQA